jgi:hypothetical protein
MQAMSQSRRTRRSSHTVAILAAILALSLTTVAQATKFWKNGVVTGNWNVSNNWSAAGPGGGDNGGVPVASENVNIVHTDGTARTVTLDVSTPSLGLLSIDLTGGSATTTNTLSIPNNVNLTASAIAVGVTGGSGGAAGRGAVNQANGTVTTNAGSDLILGWNSGATGTYTLSGGALVANQAEFIGYGGTGTFNHSAGTNTINASALGSLTLAANTGSIGTYNLSGTGQLESNESEYVGRDGTGNFIQTGGSNTIQGEGNNLYLGQGTTGKGTYTLSGGTLSVGNNTYVGFISGLDNSFVHTGGTHSIAGSLNIGTDNAVFNSRGTYSINGAATLSTNVVQIGGGTNSLGTLTIENGGTVLAGGAAVRRTGSVNVSGTGSTVTISGALVHEGNFNITNGGAAHVANLVEVFDASISVSGAGASFSSSTVFIYAGSNASFIIGDQGLMDFGSLVVTDGTINLHGGTLRLTSYSRNTINSDLNFSAGTLHLTGNRTAGTDVAIADFFGATTHATIFAGKGLTVDGTLTVHTALTLDGGTLTVGNLVNNGTFNFSAGTLNINQASANVNTPIVTGNPSTINVNANLISLGSAASFAGFNHQGVLNIGANTVTLNSAGYARLGVLTTLAGGTINAPNGVTLPGGSNLQGTGQIATRVTGERGAVIEAGGSLSVGDNSSPAGYNFDGELRVKQNTVTLNSSAVAGLGNLTTMGFGGVFGTINATNGYVVDFDEAVTGYGTINSTNTLAKHATINGAVQGTDATFRITLSGYIKGTGTFNNVTFTGTYSPGLSPTIVSAGNLELSSTNTLIMELGGTTPGTGHDQIQASGSLTLGGTLDVDLINGFTPTAGQSFNLFDWTDMTGTFSSLVLPPLAGLAWNTSQLYTSGVLSVASLGVPGDYNGNGTVDAADYVLWRKGGPLLNEVDTPGTVNAVDYTEWRARFGNTGSGSGSGATAGWAPPEGWSSSAVPEPVALLLFVSLSPLLPLYRAVAKNHS